MRFDTWLRVVLAGGGVLGVLIYAFILVIDPYQVVPFAPALPRAPISTNQRFSYPAIARSAAFDSAVIGTSTTRAPPRRNVFGGIVLAWKKLKQF